MLQAVRELLLARGITLCAPVALSACCIRKPYLLERAGIDGGTAFLFAVPYYTTFCDDPARNISAYAVSKDYHLFFEMLFEEILPILHQRFPTYRFAGFADHSPIDEVDAAARAGLGCIGCNHLLLTERYASYVFLGEILTDAVLDTPGAEPIACAACGACRRACPAALEASGCLSALSQKKGVLTPAEQNTLLESKTVWGCDRCQEHCPVTLAAQKSGSIYTSIPFFGEAPLPHLTESVIAEMSDTEFSKRAYSWRGRQTILRNLTFTGKEEEQ